MNFKTLLSIYSHLLITASALPIQNFADDGCLPESSIDEPILKFQTHIRNNNDDFVLSLSKRDDDKILTVSTDVHQILLTYPLVIENQNINAVVDTASYSSWIFNKITNPSSPLCSVESCIEIDSDQISSDHYSISYQGDFGASGYWANGELSIENSNSVNFKFGLVDAVTGNSGGYAWSGFGYKESNKDENIQILDILAAGNVIEKKILALDYDEIENWSSSTMGNGNLYIGGYDGVQSDDLQWFPFLNNETSNRITFDKIVSNDGDELAAGGQKTIILDSGSTTLMMKEKYFDTLFKDFSYDETYPEFFHCSDYENFNIKFVIGGKTLEIPILNLSWNNYQSDNDLCQLMVTKLDDDDSLELVFGQYVIKNLVSVFDIDNHVFGVAANATGVSLT